MGSIAPPLGLRQTLYLEVYNTRFFNVLGVNFYLRPLSSWIGMICNIVNLLKALQRATSLLVLAFPLDKQLIMSTTNILCLSESGFFNRKIKVIKPGLCCCMSCRLVMGGENWEIFFDPFVLWERKDIFCFGWNGTWKCLSLSLCSGPVPSLIRCCCMQNRYSWEECKGFQLFEKRWVGAFRVREFIKIPCCVAG